MILNNEQKVVYTAILNLFEDNFNIKALYAAVNKPKSSVRRIMGELVKLGLVKHGEKLGDYQRTTSQ